MRHWLLEVQIDGRTYRWAELPLTVTTDAGDDLDYAPGLGALELAPGDQVTVEVLDPSVDWPSLATEIDGAAAVLRRWEEGTTLELAQVYATGLVEEVEYGGRTEPITWTIGQVAGSPLGLGTQVPDALARVDATTWPVAGTAPVLGADAGMAYPVILGLPGNVGTGDPEPVVPVPLAQWDTADATTYLVVDEDGGASDLVQVYLRNDAVDEIGYATVARVVDALGRGVRAATFTGINPVKPATATDTDRVYAGYFPAGGGGPRSAYDVVEYLLRRYGASSTDWSRLPEVRDVLGPYLVDTWIDDPLPDPWSWLEGALLGDLPVEIRTSTRGRYLLARRYRTTPSRVMGALDADSGDLARAGPVSRDGAPTNEYTAELRRAQTGVYLARLVLTGSPSLVAGVSVPVPVADQSVIVASSAPCVASVARYGRRQSGPVTIDWTWDLGTALRVLEVRAEREAIPARLVEYDTRREDLEEGDEVLLTDSELGWLDEPAIVDAPPVVGGPLVRLRLRLPVLS